MWFEHSENTSGPVPESLPAEGFPLPSDSAFSRCHMSVHHLVQSYATSVLSFSTANRLALQILQSVPPLGFSWSLRDDWVIPHLIFFLTFIKSVCGSVIRKWGKRCWCECAAACARPEVGRLCVLTAEVSLASFLWLFRLFYTLRNEMIFFSAGKNTRGYLPKCCTIRRLAATAPR